MPVLRLDLKSATALLSEQLQCDQRILFAKPEGILSRLQLLAQEQVKEPVETVTGQYDFIFLRAVILISESGMIPPSYRPEFRVFIHQNTDQCFGTVIKLADAVIQKYIFPQSDGSSILDIFQKAADIFHHVKLLSAHTKGQGGILLPEQISGNKLRDQPGWFLCLCRQNVPVHIAFQQHPAIAVCHRK